MNNNEVYVATWSDGARERVVVRRSRFHGTWFQHPDPLKMQREAEALAAAAAGGIPVPRVLHFDERRQLLIQAWLPAEGRPDRERLGLDNPFWDEAAAILAHLHAVRPTPAVAPAVTLASTLSLYRRWAADANADALIEFVKKLEGRLPPPIPARLVHGDAHYSNWGVTNGHVVALYDFEHARLADPRIDLASVFAYLPSAQRDALAARVLGAYRGAGGEVGDEDWRWWSGFLLVRIGCWLVHLRVEPGGTCGEFDEAEYQQALQDAQRAVVELG